jgi:hypothetical protein
VLEPVLVCDAVAALEEVAAAPGVACLDEGLEEVELRVMPPQRQKEASRKWISVSRLSRHWRRRRRTHGGMWSRAPATRHRCSATRGGRSADTMMPCTCPRSARSGRQPAASARGRTGGGRQEGLKGGDVAASRAEGRILPEHPMDSGVGSLRTERVEATTSSRAFTNTRRSVEASTKRRSDAVLGSQGTDIRGPPPPCPAFPCWSAT